MLLAILSFLCCVELHVHAQDVHMLGCDSDGLIHVKENRLFSVSCHNHFYPRYSGELYMHWQIQPWRQNETLDLVCSDRDSCTTHPEVQAMMFIPLFSDLHIPNVERAMFNSSTITCSVSANGSDISANASCLIDVTYVHLSGCDSDGLIHMQENRSFYAECYNLFYRKYPGETYMHWQIQPWRQNETLDLVCSERDLCMHHPEVRAMMFDPFFSDLHISNVERAMFNSSTITCSVSADGSDTSANASCLIDVTYPADFGACQFQVHKENWTVIGSCDVTKVYSSAANYGCTVRQKMYYNGRTRWTDVAVVTTLSSMTSFTETSSGLVYYRGQCLFAFPVPSGAGNATYYARNTPRSNMLETNQTLFIDPPSTPTLTSCEQDFLIEGGHSPKPSCVCGVTSLGSPTGRLVWRSGDVVLLSGSYGDTSLPFPYEKMDRTHNGEALMCQVDWVDRKNSTSFTANVAYGPDTAAIFVHSDQDKVTLLCTSLHVHPVSALLTHWGGLCQGHQGRTCTLTTPSPESDGKVTCTLTNQKVPGKQATVTWIQKLDGDTTTLPVDKGHQLNSANSSLSEGVGLGVGVTLAVVLVVVAVLLVLLWRRHLLPACPRLTPTYASPSKRQQREEEANRTYTDLSVYEHVGAASSPRQHENTNTGTAGANDGDNHVYANTAADFQV